MTRYVLTFQSTKSTVPEIVRLRQMLKAALRRFAFKCVDMQELPDTDKKKDTAK